MEGIVGELHRALSVRGSTALPRAVLNHSPAAGCERAFKSELSDLLSRTTSRKDFNSPASFEFKDIDALWAESRGSDCPGYVTDTLNYLRLYRALAQKMRTLELADKTWFDTRLPPETVRELVAAVESVDGFEPDLTSSALVLGKLHALCDRVKAAECFDRATATPEGDLGPFQLDCGATTYFDHATVKRSEKSIAERRISLPALQQEEVTCDDDVRFLIVFSCDESFLRIYLPYWLSVAGYLESRRLAFHFLVVGRGREVGDSIDKARDLVRALGRFRDGDPRAGGNNVSFASTTVPAWCPNATAFTAAARFLYAREIAERSGKRVIALDIDIRVLDDPVPWLETLPRDRIVVYPNPVSITLDPWRKFRAGIFTLPHDESAFALSRHLNDYLLLGLGKRNSWFVDQNAIEYLFEKAQEEGVTAALHPFDPQGVQRSIAGGHAIDFLLKGDSRGGRGHRAEER